MTATATKERVQVLLDPESRRLFQELAQREGLSLSAWLRRAGEERAERQQSISIQSAEELDDFFLECAEREVGDEPDWDDHYPRYPTVQILGLVGELMAVFVDTNVVMYAVGRRHPLRVEAQRFFRDSFEKPAGLVTSVEVLRELMHAYLPVRRDVTLGAAFELVRACIPTIWDLTPEDVRHAHRLVPTYPGLGARDLLYLACCQRRGVESVKTFDRRLASAFE